VYVEVLGTVKFIWGYRCSRGRRTRIEMPVGGHKLS